MDGLLIYGADKSAYLRHEIPLSLPDPVAYIETNGSRHVFAGALDVPRLTALGAEQGFDVTPFEELGLLELMGEGQSLGDALVGAVVRGCRQLDITAVRVPGDFPLAAADQLRAGGLEVTPDGELF